MISVGKVAEGKDCLVRAVVRERNSTSLSPNVLQAIFVGKALHAKLGLSSIFNLLALRQPLSATFPQGDNSSLRICRPYINDMRLRHRE